MMKCDKAIRYCLLTLFVIVSMVVSCKRVDEGRLASNRAVDHISEHHDAPPPLDTPREFFFKPLNFEGRSLPISDFQIEQGEDGEEIIYLLHTNMGHEYPYADYEFSAGIAKLSCKQDVCSKVWFLSDRKIKNRLDHPHTIHVLPDETILISDSSKVPARAIRVNTDGEILFEYETRGLLNEFLPSTTHADVGGLVVGLSHEGMVQIINKQCSLLWEYFVPKNSDSIQVHHTHQIPESGNMLICLAESGDHRNGRIIEVSLEKEIVWSFEHPDLLWPRNAQRLSNGDTVIGHQNGIWKVTPEGKILWKLTANNMKVYNLKVFEDKGIIVFPQGEFLLWVDQAGRIVRSLVNELPKPLGKNVIRELKNHPYLSN